MKAKTLEEFRSKLLDSPDLLEKLKSDPKEFIEKIEIVHPLNGDNWIYRIVVIALGLSLFVTAIGCIVILKSDNQDGLNAQMLTVITSIASGAIGALAGLLAPSPKQNIE